MCSLSMFLQHGADHAGGVPRRSNMMLMACKSVSKDKLVRVAFPPYGTLAEV